MYRIIRILFLAVFILLLGSSLYSNEKNTGAKLLVNNIMMKTGTDNNFNPDSIKLYSYGGSSPMRNSGIALLASGSGIFGLFYILGILVTSASWIVADKSPGDYSLMYQSIGFSCIPVVGLYIVPYKTYEAYYNDGDTMGMVGETVSRAALAAAVLFNFFQIAGLSMLIIGAVLLGSSSQYSSIIKKYTPVFASSKTYNFTTKKYEDAMILGLSIKL